MWGWRWWWPFSFLPPLLPEVWTARQGVNFMGFAACVFVSFQGLLQGQGLHIEKKDQFIISSCWKKGFVETRYIYFDEPPCYLRQRFSERGRSGRMWWSFGDTAQMFGKHMLAMLLYPAWVLSRRESARHGKVEKGASTCGDKAPWPDLIRFPVPPGSCSVSSSTRFMFACMTVWLMTVMTCSICRNTGIKMSRVPCFSRAIKSSD